MATETAVTFVQIAAADGYLYAIDTLGQIWRYRHYRSEEPYWEWELLPGHPGGVDECCREDFSGPCRHHKKPRPGVVR